MMAELFCWVLFVFFLLFTVGVSILGIYVLIRFIRYLASRSDEQIFL